MVIIGLSDAADGGCAGGGGSHCQPFDLDVTPFDDDDADVWKLVG